MSRPFSVVRRPLNPIGAAGVVTIKDVAAEGVEQMQRDRSWLGPLGGLMIVALLVGRLGAGAFVDALRHLDASSVAAGAAIAVLTTVCGAWRWVLVARGLGASCPCARPSPSPTGRSSST